MTKNTRKMAEALVVLMILSWALTHLLVLGFALTLLGALAIAGKANARQRKRSAALTAVKVPPPRIDRDPIGLEAVHVHSARPIRPEHAPQPDDFDMPDVRMTWWCAEGYHEECPTYLRGSLGDEELRPCGCGCHSD